MAQTLGMTGMDPATESALKAAFEQANARLGRAWRLVSDQDAEYVVVDMDSMYGPMSWLRLHGAGKRVIGLTAAMRTQADFHLAQPFTGDSVATLLDSIASGTAAPEAAPVAPITPAVPSGMSASPVPQDQLPEELPALRDEEELAPVGPKLPDSVEAGTLAPTTVQPAPAPPVAGPVAARARGFFDWLAPGALSGRVRYRDLLIDADQRQYHGPAALKPLASYFEGAVDRDAFAPVDAATWDRDSAALGAAQPLVRLQWYGGLVVGHGALLPGHDTDGRFRLGKWPQTEREFPKHFRIATQMMKGPATLDEIAAGSGVPREDVVDFVNANLATGYAEQVRESSSEPADAAKAGLFGRLRGK
jgi:hypothetical protein